MRELLRKKHKKFNLMNNFNAFGYRTILLISCIEVKRCIY